MAITRWDPFRELEQVSDQLNRMFGRTSSARGDAREMMTAANWVPPVDVLETDRDYIIKAELPEVKKDDVRVTVQDGVLTIFGERRQEQEEKDKRYHRVERSYGSFVRSFTLPEFVDEAKVSAEFKDGVLRLQLPKTEKARPRAIEVKVS